MAAKSRICKWGSSLAVHIPKPIPKQRGLHEGSAVEMVSRGNQVMLRQKTYSLGDILATVTDENLHPEVDTGSAQGNEAWQKGPTSPATGKSCD